MSKTPLSKPITAGQVGRTKHRAIRRPVHRREEFSTRSAGSFHLRVDASSKKYCDASIREGPVDGRRLRPSGAPPLPRPRPLDTRIWSAIRPASAVRASSSTSRRRSRCGRLAPARRHGASSTSTSSAPRPSNVRDAARSLTCEVDANEIVAHLQGEKFRRAHARRGLSTTRPAVHPGRHADGDGLHARPRRSAVRQVQDGRARSRDVEVQRAALRPRRHQVSEPPRDAPLRAPEARRRRSAASSASSCSRGSRSCSSGASIWRRRSRRTVSPRRSTSTAGARCSSAWSPSPSTAPTSPTTTRRPVSSSSRTRRASRPKPTA
jgi:hypothetical protein